MKGWFERVLAYGFAYVDGARFETGLFKGRRALLAVTTGGTTARFGADGVYGEIDRVLWPVQRLTLQYMGYTTEDPFVAYAAPRVSDAERATYLEQFAARALATAGKPIEWSGQQQRPLDLVPEGAWAKDR
jgi:NAD(P)H dehydrogenase (quinone)